MGVPKEEEALFDAVVEMLKDHCWGSGKNQKKSNWVIKSIYQVHLSKTS